MPQVINTNVMSLQSQRMVDRSQNSLQTSLQRLSSGLRINTAKDDAAGLALSQSLTSQINGYNQNIRNANDAVGMIQTAEGALEEVSNMVQRVRELAVQSANGNYTSAERTHLNREVSELVMEISRVADAITFNGVKVIGSTASAKMWIGQDSASAANAINVAFKDIAGTSGIGSFVTGAGISTVANALSTMTLADNAIDRINTIRADLGAKQNRFEGTVRNLQNVAANLSGSRSRIVDADFASETANMTRAQILQQAGTAMLAQANAAPQNVLSLLR
jgi:flagellin